MPSKHAHLPSETLAEIHAAASDLFDLLGEHPALGAGLLSGLCDLIWSTEDALAAADPLIDRQPVIVVTEMLAVQ